MRRLILAISAALLLGCGGAPEGFAEQADALAPAAAHIARSGMVRKLGPGLTAPAATTPPAAPAHHACPATGPCRVIPLGDSITDGGTSGAVGYRPPLWHLTVAAGLPVLFVGSLASGPDLVDDQPWPRNHEGHSGWSIDAVGSIMTGLQVIATDRITSYQPDVVLLMIGTNDVQLGIDAGAPARLERLVDTIFAAKPDVTVLLSTIIPTQDAAQNLRVDAFNAGVPAVVEHESAAGHSVVFVDHHAAFTANPNFAAELLADKLHPNQDGHNVLARGWLEALTEIR